MKPKKLDRTLLKSKLNTCFTVKKCFAEIPFFIPLKAELGNKQSWHKIHTHGPNVRYVSLPKKIGTFLFVCKGNCHEHLSVNRRNWYKRLGILENGVAQ